MDGSLAEVNLEIFVYQSNLLHKESNRRGPAVQTEKVPYAHPLSVVELGSGNFTLVHFA